MKIYIGCPIIGFNPEEWQRHYSNLEKLKNELRKHGHEILEFKGNNVQRVAPAGTVFDWDYKQCMACDAMIAIALKPSTGMGMEIALCLTRTSGPENKPSPAFVFGTAPQDAEVSRMVTECNLPNFVFERYTNFENITNMFEVAYKKNHDQQSAKE